MFAMLGLMSSNVDWEARDPWDIADGVLEARKQKEEGLVAIKRKVKVK
jgi:hypothetical protein